jgi:hypothetical protein
MGTTYYKVGNGLEVTCGNRKLGTDTIIINMGSATECPSKKLGLCQIPDGKCYAMHPEKMYRGCLPYRTRQAAYWLNTDADSICADFAQLFNQHKSLLKKVVYLRYNESGDFYSQECVDKLSIVANFLKTKYGITTYGYSARRDLDFTAATFLVKGSSHNAGNTGKVISRKLPKVTGTKVKTYHEQGKRYYVCPGSCVACKLCKVTKVVNVVIPLH